MWGLYGCVCILFLVLSGRFFYGDMGEWSKPRVSKNSLSQVRILLSPQFLIMPKCFSGIRASVVKSCGDLRVCVCILSSGLPGCFLGDVGEWSKPRVCKTLYHKFESCHRLFIVYPVIFLRTSGLPIKNVVGCIFLQCCPDVFFRFLRP